MSYRISDSKHYYQTFFCPSLLSTEILGSLMLSHISLILPLFCNFFLLVFSFSSIPPQLLRPFHLPCFSLPTPPTFFPTGESAPLETLRGSLHTLSLSFFHTRASSHSSGPTPKPVSRPLCPGPLRLSEYSGVKRPAAC